MYRTTAKKKIFGIDDVIFLLLFKKNSPHRNVQRNIN